MKLKMIIVWSVAAVALVLVGAACNRSSEKSAPAANQTASTNNPTAAYYTCPMHPSVKSDVPGACHICGMDLVPVYTNTPAAKP